MTWKPLAEATKADDVGNPISILLYLPEASKVYPSLWTELPEGPDV